MDESVRELMIVVKKWAKENEICSAQDNTPSSYAWMNLVIFYLQCIEYVPNLQCPKLMKKFGLQRSPNEYWHNVNNLDTCYLTLDQALQVWKRPENLVKTPISATALLYGFFNFYAVEFMGAVSMISIKRGREEILPKTVFRKCSPFFCIEDPFETFDSHCPHDLGIPVNEKQTMRIFYLLEQAEEHLRKALLGVDGIALDDVLSLWPSKEQIEEGAAKKAGARSQGGGGSKKKKKKGKRNRGQQQKKQPKGQKEGGATGKVQNKQQTKPQEAPKTKQEGKGKKQQQHHKKEKDTPNNDKQQGKDAVNNHQKRGGGPKKANKPQNQGTGAKTTENSKSNNKKNGAGVNTAKADGGSNNHAKNGEDKNKAKAGGISQKNRRLGKKKSQEGPRQQQQSLNAKPKSHHPKE